MAETLTQNLVFDVQFGAIRGDAQARRAIEEMASSAMGAGTVKGIRGASSQMEREMKRVMSAAFASGMRTEGRALHKVFEQGAKAVEAVREKIAKIDRDLASSTDRAHRQRLQRDRTALSQEITTRNAAVKTQIADLDAQAERHADLIEEAARNASRTWKQSVKKSGEGFADVVDGALNLDSLDPSRMVKDFGKKFESSMAPRMAKFGAKQAGKGGMMGGLGKAATALAGSAALIAGAAAAIGGMIAIFAAAYGQVKKLNEALLSGQSAADMFDVMESRGRGLEQRLTSLRDAALGTAYQFRMTGEEVAGMISQLNDAGLKVKEWGDYTQGAVDDLDRFTSVTHQAFVASKVFGQSVSEIGGFTAGMFHEMGKGLDSIDEGFRMIFAGAQRSTMTTKGFFTAISEASSGMALYNFRLDDTVGMLLKMTEVLGEDLAKAQVGMTGRYRNMGMQERVGVVMNAGGAGVARGIQGADFERSAAVFAKTFADSDSLPAALGQVMEGGALSMTKLGGMKEEDFGDLLYELRKEKGGDAIAMQLENMVGLARGAGSTGVLGAAEGLGSLSRQGEIAQQLVEASTLLGDEGISGMGGMNRLSYEQMTGRSGEDFEILQRLDRQMRAQFRAEGEEEGTGQQFEQWVIGALGDNKLLDAEAMRAQPVMERIAREHMMETRSISQTLKNVIANALEGIWGLVRGIWSWEGGNAQKTAMEHSEGLVDTYYDQIEATQDTIAAADDVLLNAESTATAMMAAQLSKDQAKRELVTLNESVKFEQGNYRRIAMGDDALIRQDAEREFHDQGSPTEATETEDLSVDARRASFLDQVAEVIVRTELRSQTDEDYVGGMIPNLALDPDNLAAWLTEHSQDTPEMRAAFGKGAFGQTPTFAGGEASWEHFATGGTTSWGEDVTIGAQPQYSTQMVTSQEAGRQGWGDASTGYFLRQSTLGDLNDEQQAAVLEYLEDPQFRERGLTHAPDADFLSSKGATGTQGQTFWQSIDALSGTTGMSEELQKVVDIFSGTLNDDPEEPGLLEELISTDASIAADAADSLDVEGDSLTELKKIVSELRAGQQGTGADISAGTGWSAAKVGEKLRTAAGRGEIEARLGTRSRVGGISEARSQQILRAQMALSSLPEVSDFIYQGGSMGGTITPISSRDQFLGMQPGGAIAGGMGTNVVININGGDEARVYRVVRRALAAHTARGH